MAGSSLPAIGSLLSLTLPTLMNALAGLAAGAIAVVLVKLGGRLIGRTT